MSSTKSRNSHDKRILKNILIKKKGQRCAICAKHFVFDRLTLDHIIPLDAGGTWSINNLQLACYPCNQKKANTYVDIWSKI